MIPTGGPLDSLACTEATATSQGLGLQSLAGLGLTGCKSGP